MKNLFLFLSLAFSFHSYSQFIYSSINDYGVMYHVFNPTKMKTQKGVKQIELQNTHKNGKTCTGVKNYNEDGKLTGQFKKDEKGYLTPLRKYEYNQNGKITKAIYFKKGKLKTTLSYSYNDYGKLSERKYLNSNGNVKSKNTRKYNSDSCIIESTHYRKEKISSSWKYEYHSKCENKKTTLYNKNGKVKKVWSYECKSEGEILEKKKNETQVCKWDESTKDLLIKVTQSFDEKGKIIKTVSKYTLKDTLLVEISKYDENEVLKSRYTYNKDKKKPLIETDYKNGKKQYELIFKYENDKLISYAYYKRNQQRTIITYQYKNGKIIAFDKSFRNGKTGEKTVYEYNDSLLVKSVATNLKGKLIYSLSMKYDEFYSVK